MAILFAGAGAANRVFKQCLGDQDQLQREAFRVLIFAATVLSLVLRV
jgi:hypothetical protein